MEASLKIRIVDPLATTDWDDRVSQLAGATFFYSASWLRTLQQSYRFRPCYFCGENNGKLVAVLPMMEVNSWLTGRRGVSLPFTDECSALCADGATFQALFEAARKHGADRGWKYLECRGGKEFLPDTPASTHFFSHQIPLFQDIKKTTGQFNDSVRRAVRKAEKSGVEIEFSQTLAAVADFHSLLCKTRKRHGVPPQPFSFFAAIQQQIMASGKGWVVLARHQGKPIAGAVYFHFGKQVLYKYGASDDTQQHLRGNNLVMARAIEWYANHGFDTFDFGRTSLHNEGLRQFKLGWGATERQISYIRINPSNGACLSAPDKVDGLPQRILHYTPVLLSRLIGSVLYRHVA